MNEAEIARTTPSIVLYNTAPWDSALPVLRCRAPAEQAGFDMFQGNEGSDIDPEKVAQADIVLVQRDFPRFIKASERILSIARQQNKPVVYETDDLLFDLPESHISRHDLSNYLHHILWFLVEADAVTTSTAYLRDYLKPLNPNMWITPNYLIDKFWTFKEPGMNDGNGPMVIGYMGGQTHYQDILYLTPILLRILDRFRDRIILRFWCGPIPEELSQHPCVEWRAVNHEHYAEFAQLMCAQSFDILIAPLEDNPFNRAKSDLKFLEYSCFGAPGIFSRLPPYENIVEHEKNGFLASTPAEWEHWLGHLIENPSIRNEVAREAQATVRRDWLLSKHSHDWGDTIHRAVSTTTKKDIHLPQRYPIVRLAQEITHSRFITLEQQNQSLLSEYDRLSDKSTRLEAENESLRAQLGEIQQSRSWRLINQLRLRLAPPGSTRELLLKKLGMVSPEV